MIRNRLFIAASLFLYACAGGGAVDTKGSGDGKDAIDGQAQGTVATGGGDLNVRSGPGTDNGVIATVPNGAVVTISCQLQGESVDGDVAWDYLPDYGGFVTDDFVMTGWNDFIDGVPRCDDGGNGSGSGGAPPGSGSGGGDGSGAGPTDGDLGAAAVSEARQFANYHESDANYCNQFSSDLGRPCEQWCADFVNYVWQQVGADTGGLSAAAISFYPYGSSHGTWKDGAYADGVQPGDAVIWANSYGWGEHVGMVTAVFDDGRISVINGDFFDDGGLSRVSEITIYRDNQVGTGAPILGYSSPVR